MLKLEGFPLLSAPHPASTLLESPFNTVCEICLLLLAETVERAGTSREDPVPGQPWATVTGDWNTGHHPFLTPAFITLYAGHGEKFILGGGAQEMIPSMGLP